MVVDRDLVARRDRRKRDHIECHVREMATDPPGGVTCAGGVVAASSSGSFMPDLNALMPLAKSPMTLEILPLPPNNSTPTPITSSQCQMLREPIRQPQTLNAATL